MPLGSISVSISNSKQIDIRHHVLRGLVAKGEIVVIHM